MSSFEEPHINKYDGMISGLLFLSGLGYWWKSFLTWAVGGGMSIHVHDGVMI